MGLFDWEMGLFGGTAGGTTYFGQGSVNYRGDSFTQDLYNQLADLGSKASNPKNNPFGGTLTTPAGILAGRMAMMNAFNNWLTGGRPSPIDVGVTLARSAALAGAKEKAAAGSGFSGAFGLGKVLGFGLPESSSPTMGSSPYSVPPIPSLVPGTASKGS